MIKYFLKIKRKAAFILIAVLVLTVNYGNAQSGKELVIVAFGNSTTAPQTTIKVYAVQLNEILASSGINSKVINAGIGGSHTGSYKDNSKHKRAHGRDRIDTAVLRYHPDCVTINFGIMIPGRMMARKGHPEFSFTNPQNLSFFIDRIRSEGSIEDFIIES